MLKGPSSLLACAATMVYLTTLAKFSSIVTPVLAFTDLSIPTRRTKFRSESEFSAPVSLRRQRPISGFLAQDDYNDKGDYDYDVLFNSPEERSRLRRRTVFDHERWLKHRSTDRFFRNLGTMPKSYVISGLLDEVAVIAAFSLSIVIWNEALFDGWTDLAGVKHGPIETAGGILGILPRLVLPSLPFSLSSPPLGLLLVFRTNTSYARWNDGRMAWREITTRSRSVLLTAATWVSSGSSSDTKEIRADKAKALQRLGAAMWALPRTLRKRVSGDWDPHGEYESEIRSRLDAKWAERILSARNPITRAQSDLLKAVEDLPGVGFKEKMMLANNVNAIVDLCGKCEGLYTTPVPLSYTRHTARFLTIWMLLLPVALYEPFSTSWNHLAVIPAITVLSVLFFGVEEIAVSLEEPFSILPLDKSTEDIWLTAEDTLEWFAADNDDSGWSSSDGE